MKLFSRFKKHKFPLTLLVCSALALSSAGIAFSPRGILLAVAAADAPLEVKNLTVEYKENPLGIDETNPLFGWQLSGGGRGVVQSYYNIQVSTSIGFSPSDVVWQSGRIESENTNAVAYGSAGNAKPLLPRTKYFWRVTSYTNAGEKRSDVAEFETGLMTDNRADAEWNGAEWLTPDKTTGATVNYDFSVKFKMESGGVGFVFGHSDNSNANFWQVNIGTQGKVLLRPHMRKNGSYSYSDYDVTDIVPWEKRNDEHTLKVEVRGTSTKTYIDGKHVSAMDGVTVASAGYGSFGFRVDKDDNAAAVAWDFKYTDVLGSVLMEKPATPSDNPFESNNTEVVALGSGGYGVRVTANANDLYITAGNSSDTALVRRDFTAENKEIESARLYISALGVYDAYINGERVHESYLAPGWTDYRSRVEYQTYDVTEYVRGGANAVGLVLSGGWYSGDLAYFGPNRYDSVNAFILNLVITYADGSETSVVSADDGEWKHTYVNQYSSAGLLAGERYDARLEYAGSAYGWIDPDLYTAADVNADGNWMGCMPYAREIWRGRTLDEMKIVSQIEPPVMQTATVTAKTVSQVNGKFVVDFGQNFAGLVRITMRGEAGQKVTLRHAEILSDNTGKEQDVGPLGSLYTANLRTAAATDTYTFARSETVTYSPRLTFHGFRYIEISGLKYKPSLSDIEGVVLSSDLKRTGEYETSNEEITNRIYQNQYWGQLSNFLSVPTDCPQRNERLGWTGDAMVFVDTANYNMNAYNFYRKYMFDVRDSQHRSDNQIGNNDAMFGAISEYAPFPENYLGNGDPTREYVGNHGDVVWGAVSVSVPYSLYRAYGDTRILAENYESMNLWFDYLRRITAGNDGHLLRSAQVHYGDWVSLERTDKGLIGNAYLAYNYALMGEIAEALAAHEKDEVAKLSYAADSEKFRRAYSEVKAAFIEKYVDPSTMEVWLNPSDPESDPKMNDGYSQASQTLALAFGLVPGNTAAEVAANRNKMAERLASKLHAAYDCTGYDGASNTKSADTLTLGFSSIRFFNITLSENGLNDLAYHMVQNTDYPSWGYSVVNGATTIWERWNSYSYEGYQNVGMNSYNHYSFGSVGEWFYRYSLGIQADTEKAGYRRAVIKPYTDESMTFVKGSYDSVCGRIASGWTRNANGTVTYGISVPSGVTATVILPKGSAALTESGQALAAGENGIISVREENGEYRIEIGSGDYTFVC